MHGFDPGAGFFDALLQDPVLAKVKLISEPWDIGPGGYQVGKHPAGLAEWNDRFRDDVRCFWKGEAGMRGAIAARLLGSADLFNHHRRRAWSSINFVTAHDGFTLQDLVTYNHKHNHANGEDNRDGSDHNRSANWGVEGPTDDPNIIVIRERVKRAMMMTLLFSNGTPMLLGGDEFGRTQHGNNNPYCQDNEISWFDWRGAESEKGKTMTDFVCRCIAARKALPTVRSTRFLTASSKTLQGVPDTSWFDETGNVMTPERWNFTEGRLLALRRIAPDSVTGTISASLLLMNALNEDREFLLPHPLMGWRAIIDAAEPAGPAIRQPDQNRITVAAHSAVLLVAENVIL